MTIPIAIGNEWAFLCLGGFNGVRFEKGKWHRAQSTGRRAQGSGHGAWSMGLKVTIEIL